MQILNTIYPGRGLPGSPWSRTESKDSETGPILRFTSAEWAAWLDGAKKGEFDHL